MLPAGRHSDKHLCPAHEGGPVAAGASNVETNSEAQARGADRAECHGPPDFIVTGSGTVTVNSKPAARSTDKTMHQGTVVMGSGNVMIGGPTVGVTLGNPDTGKAACIAAAYGRTPPVGAVDKHGRPLPRRTTKQSYNNCGVESTRILINRATKHKLTEDELLDWAIDHGEADGPKDPANRYKSGGTTVTQTEDTLREHGVESTQERQTMENISQAVAEGKGVITSHTSSTLWDDRQYNGNHAVNVTGLVYDADGKLVSVVTLDTGTGNCATLVPAGRYEKSLLSWPSNAVITKKPIW
jgi:uncharacterized Zn-binding protein involved in type VI secretion